MYKLLSSKRTKKSRRATKDQIQWRLSRRRKTCTRKITAVELHAWHAGNYKEGGARGQQLSHYVCIKQKAVPRGEDDTKGGRGIRWELLVASHPFVGVALLGSHVSGRLSSSEKLPVSPTLLRVYFYKREQIESIGRIARANAIEPMFRVMLILRSLC